MKRYLGPALFLLFFLTTGVWAVIVYLFPKYSATLTTAVGEWFIVLLGVSALLSNINNIITLIRRFYKIAGTNKSRIFPPSHRRKVAIVVDQEKHHRSCFWELLYEDTDNDLWRLADFKLKSVADELSKKKNCAGYLFDKEKTDIIIINWDAINGDPVYGSDRAFSLFEHYKPDMTDWMRHGGKIIVESQGASWGALQKAYDVFSDCFPGTHVVVESRLLKTGDEIIVDPSNSNHYIVRDISDAELILDKKSPFETADWFPHDLNIPSLREVKEEPRKVYRGWFEEFSGWTPLLLTKDNHDNHKPVMIYKAFSDGNEGGGCVLTTMFIASSEYIKLIEKLLKWNPGRDHHN